MKSQPAIYSRYFTYIKPLTKLPIIKNYGPAIFTLLTISTLVFFAIRPTVETILVLQKKLVNSDEILQKITEKVDNLSLGKKNYDHLDQNIKNKISSAIPNTVSLKSVISNLEQAAKIHEASISALQIQPLVISTKNDNQIGSLSEISFTFNVESNYKNLIALLQDLKSSSRVISIDNLSLSKTANDKGLVMSLSGKAYYLK